MLDRTNMDTRYALRKECKDKRQTRQHETKLWRTVDNQLFLCD